MNIYWSLRRTRSILRLFVREDISFYFSFVATDNATNQTAIVDAAIKALSRGIWLNRETCREAATTISQRIVARPRILTPLAGVMSTLAQGGRTDRQTDRFATIRLGFQLDLRKRLEDTHSSRTALLLVKVAPTRIIMADVIQEGTATNICLTPVAQGSV